MAALSARIYSGEAARSTQNELPTFFQQAITDSQQLFKSTARSLLGLVTKRWNSASGLILCNAFNAPHRKEQTTEANERFFMNDGTNPIVEGIQVETAQEYSSSGDFVEYSPTLFAGAVQRK
jgi:hypothetical protein